MDVEQSYSSYPNKQFCVLIPGGRIHRGIRVAVGHQGSGFCLYYFVPVLYPGYSVVYRSYTLSNNPVVMVGFGDFPKRPVC